MEKSEKTAEVEFLEGQFAKAQVALCTEYRGLTVAKITDLRRKLRESGCVGRVVKNTLARLAVEKTLASKNKAEADKFSAMLKGPCMLVFSADPVAPAKVVSKFAKDQEIFKIKGGWFEGACIDKSGVEQLSTMPSREEVLGKLLALMNAPATQLLRLMQAPGTQVTRVIEAQRKKLETV